MKTFDDAFELGKQAALKNFSDIPYLDANLVKILDKQSDNLEIIVSKWIDGYNIIQKTNYHTSNI